MKQFDTIRGNTVPSTNQVSRDIARYGESGVKILIVGNSITRHAPKASIGWTNDFGMAASREENDYVHLLMRRITGQREAQFMVAQCSSFESGYFKEDFTLEAYRALREFGAEVIVLRIGENVSGEGAERGVSFAQAYRDFVKYIDPNNAAVVFTTSFWHNVYSDEAIRSLAAEYGSQAAELGALGERAEYRADGLFEHEGVARHPGDRGMQTIADLIYPYIADGICGE